jgi:SurA N-terminal domain
VTASRGRRRGRKRWTAAVVLLALTGLSALSGCSSNLTPGVAATINGQAIQQDEVDSVVSAACAYTAASAGSQSAAPRASLANLRATITAALVQFALIDRAAAAMKLTVDQAAIAQNASQNSIPSGLSKADTAALKSFFDAVGKSTAETQLIGAHLADPSITTSSQVQSDQTAQASSYLAKYVTKQEVRINPAYGRWNGKTVVGGSGSLSDPVSAAAKDSQEAATNSKANTSDLPASQVC